MSELFELTALEASRKLERKEISARELTDACLKRIENIEPRVQAFLNVTAEEAFSYVSASL